MAVQPSFTRTLRYYYHRLFPRHERSLPVAVSVFLGVWIGLMPTLGIALILTAIAAQIARVPKGPGLLASFIAVPPTLFLFFYPLGYFGVGLPLLDPPAVDFNFLEEVRALNLFSVGKVASHLWDNARGHVWAFLVGMLIVATATALLAFGGTYAMMEWKRKKRLAARESRRLARESQADAPRQEPPAALT
ncbi:MAG: DUF2062 domain-containing protein [Myxococcales bacterium]|nr:DUF2062 domain-containing protein [Myxococcales bacterium]